MSIRSCETCGEPYARPYGLGDREWERRRFCSRSCTAYSSEGAGQNQYRSTNSAVVLAAANLRDHILIMYARTAAKQGITLNEAAYQAGMRP